MNDIIIHFINFIFTSNNPRICRYLSFSLFKYELVKTWKFIETDIFPRNESYIPLCTTLLQVYQYLKKYFAKLWENFWNAGKANDRNRFVFSSTEPAQQEDNIQNGQAKVIERHIPVQSSFIPNHLFPLHFYLSYIVFIHMTTFPACSNLKTLVAVRFSYV